MAELNDIKFDIEEDDELDYREERRPRRSEDRRSEVRESRDYEERESREERRPESRPESRPEPRQEPRRRREYDEEDYEERSGRRYNDRYDDRYDARDRRRYDDRDRRRYDDRYDDRRESGSERKLRVAATALGIVALVLLAALVAVYVSKSRLVGDLKVEKETLNQEMMALRQEYADLETSNATLSDSLAVEREKVDQLIERFQKTEAINRAQIRKYEQEVGTLRNIMKHYIVQIDSLNNLNMALKEDASKARREAAESKKQYNDLRSTTDEYAKQVAEGSVVKGRGVQLVAINGSGSVTDRSSRAEKLRADLFLIENSIAKRGPKIVYIRVKGPDGILMTEGSEQYFKCNGESMVYSACREVDYQGSEVEISVYFKPTVALVKGVYSVDVFTSDTKIGSGDLLLK